MTNRVLLSIGLIALLVLVLLGCTMGREGAARITATPTKTLRPVFTSTHTPTATPLPTDTPPPSDTPAPTNTSVPTDTPLPADTPIPPTEALSTETPNTTPALPTDTPRPAATNTPIPPTNTPKPQMDFRVVKQDLLPKAENVAQLYTIYIRVEDPGGNPLNGLVVWDPGQPEIKAVTGDKPDYYHAEILMGGGDYYLEVKDFKSERTKRLTTIVTNISHEDLMKAGYCTSATECSQVGFQHFAWRVIFRRTS